MKALGWTMVVLLVIVSAFGLFNWWTEAQHDKSAYEYVQDEWGWFGGSEDETTEDTVNEDVVVEDEASQAVAIVSINF